MQEKITKNFWLTVIAPIVLFWLVFYGLGYPPPTVDDMFFTGAAINLAEKGEFFNPWLAMWSDRTIDRFFVQPPFYQYALAGWLVVWGVKTKSLLLFQCFCYITFSISTALLLRFYRFSHIAIVACILLFSLWMFLSGLRQDALGMSCLAVGLWLVTHDRVKYYFLGFVFLGAAPLTSPVTIAYSVILGGTILIANYCKFKGNRKQYLTRRLLTLGSAILLLFFLFLLSIGFELTHFFSDLSWCASLRRQPWHNVLPTAIWLVKMGYGEIIYIPLYSLYFLLAIATIVKRKSIARSATVIILALTIGLIFNLFTYVATLPSHVNFFCGLGIILMLDKISWQKQYKTLICGLAIAVFCLNHSLTAVALLGRENVPSSTYETVKTFVAQNPDRTYWVDSVAARFVFDYNLPDGTIDWMSSNGAAYFWPSSIADKQPGTVWIVSPSRGASTQGLPEYPRVTLFGRRFESIPSKPYDLVVID